MKVAVISGNKILHVQIMSRNLVTYLVELGCLPVITKYYVAGINKIPVGFIRQVCNLRYSQIKLTIKCLYCVRL